MKMARMWPCYLRQVPEIEKILEEDVIDPFSRVRQNVHAASGRMTDNSSVSGRYRVDTIISNTNTIC